MKKILIALSALILSLSAYSQNGKKYQPYGTVTGITQVAVSYVSTIANLGTYPSRNPVQVTDEDRGGVFVYHPAAEALTVDNGITFAASGGGYWVRQYEGAIHAEWFGVTDDGTDQRSLIQAAIAAASGASLSFDNKNYSVSGAITLLSNSSYIFNSTKLKQLSSSDVDIISAASKTNFKILGNVELRAYGAGPNCISDGIFLDACTDFKIENIKAIGCRWDLQLGNCTKGLIGTVLGDSVKGNQAGSADAGSVFTCYGSSRINIGSIIGRMVWKAACYLSLNGVSGNNEDIQIGRVDVELDTSNVANGLAIRSGKSISIGTIKVTGGASAIYIDQNNASYVVDGVQIGEVIGRDHTEVASISNGIFILSDQATPVKNVNIANIHLTNTNVKGIYCANVNSVHFGDVHIVGAGTNGVGLKDATNVSFDNLSIVRPGIVTTSDGFFTDAGVSGLSIGTLYFEDIPATKMGFKATNSALTNVSINSIINNSINSTPDFVFYYSTNTSGDNVQIGNIIKIGTAPATGAAFYRASTFPDIKNYQLIRSAAPTNASGTWAVGDKVFNSASSSGGTIGWVCTTAGSPGTWTAYGSVGVLSGSASLNFPSIAASSTSDLTITVTGAALGDMIALGVPNASITADVTYSAWVSATDTVTIRARNNNAVSASDPATGTFKVKINK